MSTQLASLLLVVSLCAGALAQEPPWEKRRREVQDTLGGLPPELLERQSLAKIEVTPLGEAVTAAAAAAKKAARTLVDDGFHTGSRHRVPGDFGTIQAAIDAAKPRDVVVVAPGTYHELLTMKDGVKLVSDSAKDGDDLVAVEGARLELPRRALRTILDGSKANASSHGMIDFEQGCGRTTIVDGFTVQNLPEQNHHVPGHAHAINMRGASPVVMRCLIRKNGSTAIGNHVIYDDQGAPIAKRDFRVANVKHEASPVIYANVIRDNLGLGVGCNHLSTPQIFGNEVFGNDDSALGEAPTPGIGAKHGARPFIVGNLVHDNPGGGILARVGAPQGAHPIDRRTSGKAVANVVWANGKLRPGISCAGGGSKDNPVAFIGNWVFDAGAVGIGLSDGAVGLVEGNLILRSRLAGVAVHAATALALRANRVREAGGPGFTIVAASTVMGMKGNAAEANGGPRFMLRDSKVK